MKTRDEHQISYRNIFILLSISILILSPTLFFPISPDLAIFLQGGRTIAEGGAMYVDYIDIKPPAIFMFMVPVYKIFGGSEILLRLFDVLYQSATAISMYYVIKKRKGDDVVAWSAPMLYLTLYGGLFYGMAFQCETAISLPLIWTLYFIGGKATVRNAALAGLFIGVCTGFKYTFGLLLPALAVVELSKEGGQKIRRLTYYSLLFALGLIATHAPLLSHQSFNGYIKALGFLGVYARGTQNVFSGLKPLWKQTAGSFSDNFTLLIFSFFVLGSYSIFVREARKVQTALLAAAAAFTALYISIVVEEKYLDYHWVRLYVPLSLIGAAGVALAINQIGKIKLFAWHKKTALLIAVAVGLFFSPLARIAINFDRAGKYFLNPTAYYDSYRSHEGETNRNIRELIYIADSLDKIMTTSDRCIIASHGDQALYYYLKKGSISKFAHSGFYLSPRTTEAYRSEFIEELNASKAVIFRMDKGDINNLGAMDTEWEIIKKYPRMNSILENRYREYMETENFRVLIKYR